MSTGVERPRTGGTHGRDGVALLRPSGDLDARSVQHLRDELDVVLRDDSVSTVVIDLSEVRFLDSSGLGALIAARTHDVTGTRLVLRDPGFQVLRLMRLTGAYDAFTWSERH